MGMGCENMKECEEECENCPIPLNMIPDDWNCRHIKSVKITKNMYRKALHIYLIHTYPDDDITYYSKWGWLANPHWWEGENDDFPFPTEARFGCHVSVNAKLRCYPTGFMFDLNCVGDSEEVIKELEKIAEKIESDWDKHDIPVHIRNRKVKTWV